MEKTTTTFANKMLALLVSLAMAVSFMGVGNISSAFAEEEAAALAVSEGNSRVIGCADDYEANVYYVEVDKSYDSVDFSGLVGSMDDSTSMIAVITDSNFVVTGTAVATISSYAVSAQELQEGIGEYLDSEKTSSLDFSKDTYAFWITNDAYEMFFVVLKMPPAPEDTDATFSVSAGGQQLTDITCTEDGYYYTDYMSGGKYNVPLYTVTIPQGTEKVTITTAKERLFYNYNAPDEYLAGWVEDATKGSTEVTVDVDASSTDYNTGKIIPADGNPDFIQVQRVYKTDWSDGKLLYAITFKYAEPEIITPAPVVKTVKSVTKGGVTYTISGKVAKVTKVSKSKKSATILKSVKINGKTYKVSKIAKNVFKGTKVTKVTIKSTTLTKKNVKSCFKGSKVKTVKVPKSKLKAYKKIFTKKNCGKKVTVKK